MPREGGASSTPRLLASLLLPLEYWVTRPSAQLRTRRVTTTECDVAFSRRIAPEVCNFVCPPKIEGAGKTGCRLAPAVSCAMWIEENAHEHTGPAGASRPSLRSGFTAYFVLSPVNGSFATVIPGKLASREFDASTSASGPHDFAVREQLAAMVWRSRAVRRRRAHP